MHKYDSWISVNEQMPNEEEMVLVSNSKSEVTIAYYVGESKCWLNEKHYELNAIVTHWQPLPEPPYP